MRRRGVLAGTCGRLLDPAQELGDLQRVRRRIVAVGRRPVAAMRVAGPPSTAGSGSALPVSSRRRHPAMDGSGCPSPGWSPFAPACPGPRRCPRPVRARKFGRHGRCRSPDLPQPSDGSVVRRSRSDGFLGLSLVGRPGAGGFRRRIRRRRRPAARLSKAAKPGGVPGERRGVHRARSGRPACRPPRRRPPSPRPARPSSSFAPRRRPVEMPNTVRAMSRRRALVDPRPQHRRRRTDDAARSRCPSRATVASSSGLRVGLEGELRLSPCARRRPRTAPASPPPGQRPAVRRRIHRRPRSSSQSMRQVRSGPPASPRPATSRRSRRRSCGVLGRSGGLVARQCRGRSRPIGRSVNTARPIWNSSEVEGGLEVAGEIRLDERGPDRCRRSSARPMPTPASLRASASRSFGGAIGPETDGLTVGVDGRAGGVDAVGRGVWGRDRWWQPRASASPVSVRLRHVLGLHQTGDDLEVPVAADRGDAARHGEILAPEHRAGLDGGLDLFEARYQGFPLGNQLVGPVFLVEIDQLVVAGLQLLDFGLLLVGRRAGLGARRGPKRGGVVPGGLGSWGRPTSSGSPARRRPPGASPSPSSPAAPGPRTRRRARIRRRTGLRNDRARPRPRRPRPPTNRAIAVPPGTRSSVSRRFTCGADGRLGLGRDLFPDRDLALAGRRVTAKAFSTSRSISSAR